MNPDASCWRGRTAETAGVVTRWFLGALFVYMGLSKAMDPVGFLKSVRQYEVIRDPVLLNTVAAALPWFEVVCGVLLLAGVAVRGSALILTGLLVPFTWMVLRRALALDAAIPFCAIKFDCGCGGGEVPVCRKLVENSLFILLSVWLVAGAGRRWCFRYHLLPPKRSAAAAADRPSQRA